MKDTALTLQSSEDCREASKGLRAKEKIGGENSNFFFINIPWQSLDLRKAGSPHFSHIYPLILLFHFTLPAFSLLLS